ncbi:MAG: hypothetical protein PHG83_03530 [Patescibacteria group bacterium]|nr:hypothetical protein [Patescibacteria group bacterium]
MKKKGLFIVLEGTDGSGKSEQFNRLLKRLKKLGHNIKTVDFPQYGKSSAYFVEKYLTGEYGGWKEVGPYKASLFYALDRFDISAQIKKWLKQGNIILANRYVASNLGHQGVKIKNKNTRHNFFKWINDLEYGILGIPRPDINFFLHVPAKVAYKLVAKKGAREYLHGKKRDIHEQDIKHLQQAEKNYLEIVKFFPKDFLLIECASNNKLLSREEIEEKIWKAVSKFF